MGYGKDIDVGAFWYRLDRLLAERGMTMSELNEKCRLKGTYLYVIRSRRTTPSIPVLNRIAEIFGTSLDYIVNGNENRLRGETEFEENILNRLRSDSEFRSAVSVLASSDAVVRLINGS